MFIIVQYCCYAGDEVSNQLRRRVRWSSWPAGGLPAVLQPIPRSVLPGLLRQQHKRGCGECELPDRVQQWALHPGCGRGHLPDGRYGCWPTEHLSGHFRAGVPNRRRV